MAIFSGSSGIIIFPFDCPYSPASPYEICCPSTCKCTIHPQDPITTISCSNTRVFNVPALPFRSLTHHGVELHVSNNSMTTLRGAGDFKCYHLPALMYNKANTVHSNDLYDDQLPMNQTISFQKIQIKDEWICDCGFLAFLKTHHNGTNTCKDNYCLDADFCTKEFTETFYCQDDIFMALSLVIAGFAVGMMVFGMAFFSNRAAVRKARNARKAKREANIETAARRPQTVQKLPKTDEIEIKRADPKVGAPTSKTFKNNPNKIVIINPESLIDVVI